MSDPVDQGVAVRNAANSALTELVREFAVREADKTPEDLPIIVLWGARGSISSELLANLRRVEPWRAPRAFLNGETLPTDLRAHVVAGRLAFQLGRKVERFGRLRFPRFFLGLQAIHAPVDVDDDLNPGSVRKDLIKSQLENHAEGRKWLSSSATAIAAAMGMGADWKDILGLATDGAINTFLTVHILRGIGARWYRDGLGRRIADPVDALAELWNRESLDDKDFVDDVLCRAFLADLQGEFDKQFGSLFTRRTSALVLMDNVSKPSTRRFVDLLAAQATSGPLLVVAASHLRFPVAARSPANWQPDQLTTASPRRWHQQRQARGGNKYYPIWVDPVDDVPATAGPNDAESQRIAREHGLLPADFSMVAFARRLTAAHPAGLDMVIQSLIKNRNSDRDDLRRAFELPRTSAGQHDEGVAPPLDLAVFNLVLGPWPEGLRRPLALMAIAVDLSDDRIGPILDAVPQHVGRLVLEFRERDLWVTRRMTGQNPEPPRLHPFARRAIAHYLSRGAIVGGLQWENAHARLRDAAKDRHDHVSVLYHDLSLGQIRSVSDELAGRFDATEPRAWYEDLLQICRAPLARPGHAASTDAYYQHLSAGINPSAAPFVPLIAALQLHSDPLGDPNHEMCAVVANELGLIAHRKNTAQAFLVNRSSDFINCQGRWEQ